MLVGFTFKNFSSYHEKATLSMVSSSKDEYNGLNNFETSYDTLLKSNLIYGANGSGKSNLIKAIYFVKHMVVMSFFQAEIINDCEQFKFNSESLKEPSLFEVAFIIDDTLYKYGFEILEGKVMKEWLFKKAERTTPVFLRDKPEYSSIILKGELKKEAEKIKSHTRTNALFLSTAAMFNIKLADLIKRWFYDLYIITPDNITPGSTVHYLEETQNGKREILSFLQQADFNIEDFEMEVEEYDLSADEQKIIENKYLGETKNDRYKVEAKRKKLDLKTKHFIYNQDKTLLEEIKLPMSYQSQGTIKFFALAGPILDTLKKGKVLIIDEIDSRIHCAIVRFILSLFNSIDKNPLNAQLICTTHDVMLLDENIRRDQVWFVQKNKYGESELYSLNDFSDVRKSDPLLKKYLLGTFGAVPVFKED